MGILDRFRKAKETAPPPVVTNAPELPARATIATFVAVDAIGTLELADGARLRFGRSACKGFEPVVGARVIVVETARDPRGWKARAIALDPDDASYDARLNARDAAAGLTPRERSPAHALATARQLGIVTVLLRDPLPSGHQALRTWAAARGRPEGGIDVRLERDLELVLGRVGVQTYPGRGPMPRDGLDRRRVGDDFALGAAFLGVGAGIPGGERRVRAIRGRAHDAWLVMRPLGRLIERLAGAATGVVLHRAGDVVVAIDDFTRALGDPTDPARRPFAAWIDVARAPTGFASRGMDVFGLPDVYAADRDGVMAACRLMIDENRELTSEDTVAGRQVAAAPDGAIVVG